MHMDERVDGAQEDKPGKLMVIRHHIATLTVLPVSLRSLHCVDKILMKENTMML